VCRLCVAAVGCLGHPGLAISVKTQTVQLPVLRPLLLDLLRHLSRPNPEARNSEGVAAY